MFLGVMYWVVCALRYMCITSASLLKKLREWLAGGF